MLRNSCLFCSHVLILWAQRVIWLILNLLFAIFSRTQTRLESKLGQLDWILTPTSRWEYLIDNVFIYAKNWHRATSASVDSASWVLATTKIMTKKLAAPTPLAVAVGMRSRAQSLTTLTAVSRTFLCVTMESVKKTRETVITSWGTSSKTTMRKMIALSEKPMTVKKAVEWWSPMSVRMRLTVPSNTPKTASELAMWFARATIRSTGALIRAKCRIVKWLKQRGTLTTSSNSLIRTIS